MKTIWDSDGQDGEQLLITSPNITRVRYSSTDNRCTVRQSELNISSQPWPDILRVTDLLGKVRNHYRVRTSEAQAVFESHDGKEITVLKEDG